eukprot:TRINITY_DN55142_c0_g1_i1.p1 TRINITY_DN55142_c0_g1~~TRINITY_DN55142_c0_g1_i1.p1  ORF type:complete len:346 (-),score=56.75 TRINITY_DN55142_c0_g1_i1:233-1270(-)
MSDAASETAPAVIQSTQANGGEEPQVSTPPPGQYRIGTFGRAWGDAEKAAWLAQTVAKRSYQDEVLDKLTPLRENFEVVQYGALSVNPARYPLFAVHTRDWDPAKPSVLVTGGVHGYETSGIQGALLFATTKAQRFAAQFNVLVCPCVSPWAYEHVERWNPRCQDPNRCFGKDPSTHIEESSAVIALLASMGEATRWVCHIDLHETTDSDANEFLPARAAASGGVFVPSQIPDGFFLVTDQDCTERAFFAAIIDSVKKVTHIAPADANDKIVDDPVVQEGVVAIPLKKFGLCAGATDAQYAALTEVYPDSPSVTDAQCNEAQVAAVVGALEFVSQSEGAAPKAGA